MYTLKFPKQECAFEFDTIAALVEYARAHVIPEYTIERDGVIIARGSNKAGLKASPVASVSPEVADAFGMRGMPNVRVR